MLARAQLTGLEHKAALCVAASSLHLAGKIQSSPRGRSPVELAPDPMRIWTRYLAGGSSSHGNVVSHACAEPSIGNLAGTSVRPFKTQLVIPRSRDGR